MIENAKPIIPDTTPDLASFLDRMAKIQSTNLVECRSGRHVVSIDGGPWRDKKPGEAAGLHRDISAVCSLCLASRAATMTRWAASTDIGALAPRMLEWLLAREWGGSRGVCDCCLARQDGQLAESWHTLTLSGHDIMCGADRLLCDAGLAERAARDAVRVDLGISTAVKSR
jgi:hypothetical protein